MCEAGCLLSPSGRHVCGAWSLNTVVEGCDVDAGGETPNDALPMPVSARELAIVAEEVH